MKKIIAMLLALLMISTAVITVSANTTTPDAPVVRGVQTKVDGAVSVRFLSTVHSTDGDAVGYVIKATFLDGNTEVQSFTYSKAEGDSYVYNAQLLKEEIELLKSLPGCQIFSSHEARPVKSKVGVVRFLEQIYVKREKNDAYIRVSRKG